MIKTSSKIKFGTDGWRAIIADDYTLENLTRVAQATAKWVIQQKEDNRSITLGYDCRFGGKLFAETTARVFANEGIKVYLSKNFASTPMVSLSTRQKKATAGIIITASHNPSAYNGFKIKAYYGGPAIPSMISDVEALIEPEYEKDPESLDHYLNEGIIEYLDMEQLYIDHVEKNFDLDAIRNSGLKFAYDAMFGAGQNVIRKILPDTELLHCEFNPSFKGTAPEPIMKNLSEISDLIKNKGNIDSGLATDGDADRIGLLDSKGEFVDSHHLILLLVNYLFNHKKMQGKVVNSFSCTSKITTMCEKFGLDQDITKIGFKYICQIMIESEQPVLLGGEESGGIAVAGHIPERDGIWIGLTIWEYMAKTGKTLDQLIQEVYDLVGSFAVERVDLKINEDLKTTIMKNCREGVYTSFGNFKVQKVENMDGYKFHLTDDSWVMIRPSGTEPVLRTYAEAANSQKAMEILKTTKETILA